MILYFRHSYHLSSKEKQEAEVKMSQVKDVVFDEDDDDENLRWQKMLVVQDPLTKKRLLMSISRLI